MKFLVTIALSLFFFTSCSTRQSYIPSGSSGHSDKTQQQDNSDTALQQNDKPAEAENTGHGTGGVGFVVKQGKFCRALAPADWGLFSNPQASTVELSSPDKRLYAGWGVASINRAMQPYYGDFYGDPETSIKTLAGLIVSDPSIEYTSDPELLNDFFTSRTIESQGKKGLVFYHIYPQSGDNYVESVYFALADKELWPTEGGIAVNVAASIRATTQLIPPSWSRGSGSSGRGDSSEDDPTGPIDSSYNKELGWQRVHSASTGENYIMTPSDYWETGPDGPGYYRKAGNSYEKLTLGWSDY